MSRPPIERAAAELTVSFNDLGVAPLPPAAAAVTGPGGTSRERRLGPGPCGGVQVRLISASDDPSWSSASVAANPDEPARRRQVGDSVGPWRIDAIEWDRVWLVAAGVRCAAALHEGLREISQPGDLPPAAGGGLLAAAEEPAAAGRLPAEIARGIWRRSQTELVIEPRSADQLLAHGADWIGSASIDPLQVGDEVVGIELGTVTGGSLLDRLGLESGDVLRALDGRRVTSAEQVVRALNEARPNNGVVARIARSGGEFDLEVAIRVLATD